MKTPQLVQLGAFTGQSLEAIKAAINGFSAGVFTTGNIWVLDVVNGSDASGDGSFEKPFASLAQAYAQCISGNNDIVLLVGNGGTAATARLSAAFTWAKNATHLIGMCSPVLMSQRARIAPVSGTAAFTPFFTVSGSGCVFQNIQWFQGFTTGAVNQICMVLTGSRNYFKNCHIAGMGDNESAQSAGSRTLKIGSAGSGENLFEDCTIGVDTITRTQANASVELTAATVRNTFRRCLFPFMTSAAGVLGILGTGNGCCDRSNLFDNCTFENAIKSTSTQMTVLLSFTTASPGGMVIFKDSPMVGVTKYGDTNGLANSFLNMPVVSAAAGGLMLPPT